MARSVALPSSAWKVSVSRKPTRRRRPTKPKRRSQKPKTPRRKRGRRSRPPLSSLPTVKKTRKPKTRKRPKWKQHEELQMLAYKFTREHGLPSVKVVPHPKKGFATTSYLKMRWQARGPGPSHKQLFWPHGTPEIHLSTAGSPLRVESTLFHELGHYKEKYKTFERRGYMEYKDIMIQPGSTRKVQEEIEAWKIARPYLKSPAQHWLRRIALATHLRQVRYTGIPTRPFIHRDAPMNEEEAKRFVASIKVR